MLNFGNKEFRNLQEQVLKNMADIKDIHEGATVLGEFGIKVVGQVESSSDLPDPTEYEGEYGDAYVVGEEAPYDYYIFTRPFEDVDDPQWFNLGQFPAPGPQGETGETGATGATPAITAAATTSTLSAGQNASVSITKTGTDEAPHFTFAFEIPQGVQGIQGVQGAQGIQGPQGPQGIQGQKGDTGYLYTIIGQVNNESSLPLPGQVGRTSAFLVGTQEPYDVYIIIGQSLYELEWLNIGPIATVVPTTYIASESDASSGTLDATTLAAINNEINVHYMRVGSELYEFANKYNGNAYYMSLRYDSSTQMSKVARFTVALSSGAWTTGSDVVPLGAYTVTTNTSQTITGNKTFQSPIIGDGSVSGSGLILKSDSTENCIFTLPKDDDYASFTSPLGLKIIIDDLDNKTINIGDPDDEGMFGISCLDGLNIYGYFDNASQTYANMLFTLDSNSEPSIQLYAGDPSQEVGSIELNAGWTLRSTATYVYFSNLLTENEDLEPDLVWNNNGILCIGEDPSLPKLYQHYISFDFHSNTTGSNHYTSMEIKYITTSAEPIEGQGLGQDPYIGDLLQAMDQSGIILIQAFVITNNDGYMQLENAVFANDSGWLFTGFSSFDRMTDSFALPVTATIDDQSFDDTVNAL